MPSKNFYRGLDPILIKAVRYHAKRLKRYSCFAGLEVEDLEQELIIEALRCLSNYDATRSQLQTFISHVLTQYSSKLIRAATRIRRYTPYPSVPLDPTEGDEDIQEEFFQEALFTSLEFDALSSRARDLSIDIKRALLNLPPRLARLCELVLQGNTVIEAAQSLGCSRSTLYEDFHTIRQFFERMGIQEYCRHFLPTSSKKGVLKRSQARK
jgi:RNA polymerase sigma factor (sigma-70 family)